MDKILSSVGEGGSHPSSGGYSVNNQWFGFRCSMISDGVLYGMKNADLRAYLVIKSHVGRHSGDTMRCTGTVPSGSQRDDFDATVGSIPITSK